jgi:phosphodiesterase/alkaline phosphatase D-like protein
MSLAVASCRYPGWLFDRTLADSAFGELRTVIDGTAEPAPSALFLIGDQIYSDATAGVFDPKSRRERFYEAYREAWTAPNARAVLSRLPTYMMMDDHEAGNDWHPDDSLSPKERALRREGLAAFRRYQWLHSPGNRDRTMAAPDAGPWWYSFDLEGFPVFVCDTRSGRQGRDRILDRDQYDALIEWLRTAQGSPDADTADRPKFVVSPSVVLPLQKPLKDDGTAAWATRSDGWDGFPEQLVDLFSVIVREGITNVVFLCGDAHLSMHTRIWFVDGRGERRPISAWCIMAAPMYAPYPFVNSPVDEFALNNHHAPLLLPGWGTMHYEVTASTTRNGVTRVTARRKAVSNCWDILSAVLPEEAEPEAAGASTGRTMGEIV